MGILRKEKGAEQPSRRTFQDYAEVISQIVNFKHGKRKGEFVNPVLFFYFTTQKSETPVKVKKKKKKLQPPETFIVQIRKNLDSTDLGGNDCITQLSVESVN